MKYVNEDVLEVAEALLVTAKNGNASSVAVVVVDPEGSVSVQSVGVNLFPLIGGLAYAQQILSHCAQHAEDEDLIEN